MLMTQDFIVPRRQGKLIMIFQEKKFLQLVLK